MFILYSYGKSIDKITALNVVLNFKNIYHVWDECQPSSKSTKETCVGLSTKKLYGHHIKYQRETKQQKTERYYKCPAHKGMDQCLPYIVPLFTCV